MSKLVKGKTKLLCTTDRWERLGYGAKLYKKGQVYTFEMEASSGRGKGYSTLEHSGWILQKDDCVIVQLNNSMMTDALLKVDLYE